MSDVVPDIATTVVIEVRRNGPLKITGPVRIVDHEGRDIPVPANKPTISLCRCGASANKPFCDSAHKTNGFCDPPVPVA
jgi:CDGSH-type Zn-finger protein